MAARFWVGGTGTWDATTTTKWSATSGGAGGASVPTAADDVFFNSASSATNYTVTISSAVCKSLTVAGPASGNVTFSGTGALQANGSVSFPTTGMVNSWTGQLQIVGAVSATLTTNGIAIYDLFTTADVTLGSALTVNDFATWTISNRTFNTNNFAVTAGTLTIQSTAVSLTLGSSNVTITAGGYAINFPTSGAFVFNAGTSTITLSAANYIQLLSNTTTFNNVVINTSSGAGFQFVGSSPIVFNNLTLTGPASAGTRIYSLGSRATINGTLSTTGTAGNRRVWFRSNTYGIAQTLTINSAPSLTDADFRDIYVIGTAAPISGTRIGDLRGIRGITASTPKNCYRIGTGNWSANQWSDTSGGSPNTDFFPLAQDTAVFDQSTTGGTHTIDSAITNISSVDMNARTSALTLTISANLLVYGNWTNGSGTTLSSSGTLTFLGRNTQAITSAGKTFSGGITVDSYGGTVELTDALNIGVNTLTVTNGTFSTQNYNVTAGSLSSSNSNVRTINLGSSTVTASGISAVDFTTNTNLTFNAGTSSIISSGTSATSVNGGSSAGAGVTFYNVTFSSTSANTKQIVAANTFNNLTITAPASAGLMLCTFSANQTINGTLTVAGATAVRRIFLRSDTLGTTRTLTVNSLSAQDCDFRDIAIAGTAAGSSPIRAGDCGGNTGITFPAAKTVYWNLAGTQNWSATGWAPSSGGTPDINQFPLAQDTAVVNDAGSVGPDLTINAAWNIGTFDSSLRTASVNINTSTNTPFFYGDWKFGSGVTSTNAAGAITFAGRGTQTITSAGKEFGCPVTIDCVTGVVQLADAMSVRSTRTLTLTSGTFDAVTYNVTTGNFLVNGAPTLKMGSGTWTLSGTGSSTWNLGSAGGAFVFYKGTANIVLSDTSASARTFDGNARSYNKLTIGGATGTSTLTIIGNNQFTELASTKTVAHTIALGTTAQTFGAWTVTGTAGNVVTLTGTGGAHILAGACTSGIDYLAMGDIRFAATSPGEFYAGANSTATGVPVAPTYLTAKPADSTRYWVGGTGNWSDTARWSTSSGGSGGASVPRSHDDVVFDSASNATAYTATVNAVTGGIRTKALTVAGPLTGNLTLAGSAAILGIHGNVTLPATGLTRTYTGDITLASSSTGRTITTNGVSLASNITVNGVGCEWSLGSAFTSTGTFFTVTNGSINFGSYNCTLNVLRSNNGNKRTVNFGTATTTLTASAALEFGTTENARADLNVVANTSQITFSGVSASLSGNGETFYNVSFTNTSSTSFSVSGNNTFNNLTFAGLVSANVLVISFIDDQTISGTLTFSPGTNATMRTFVRSSTIGTTRTLTCAAVASLTDIDFRDITIAGAAAPVSGTRLGDCKGNSGITFAAAKTVYRRAAGASTNWSDAAGANPWSFTDGGSPDVTAFPLAQDTAVFQTYPPSGNTVSINAAYNIGTIDMSARTSNTMTLATGSTTPAIYGNWINGTGTTLSGTGTLTFAGRGSQTITSAGRTFTGKLFINSPGGTVVLQDAYTTSNGNNDTISLLAGTFDAATYSVTAATAGAFVTTAVSSSVRTLAIGSGTWSIASGFTNTVLTNLTVTGTGTISLTSASAKTFAGGGANYSGITLDQGGAGTLTITGNNTFANISNTYKATGATTIAMATTTQRVANWSASGEAGRPLTVQGTSASSPATLIIADSVNPSTDYLNIIGVRGYSL